MFGDSFFKRVEKKTNVDKNTIMSLAKKLQNSNNMKDEKVLRDMVQEISAITGNWWYLFLYFPIWVPIGIELFIFSLIVALFE